MAEAFAPPEGYVCDTARIAWIKAGAPDPSADGRHRKTRRDEWPVVVPEFVYRPSTHPRTPRQGSFAF